MSRVVQDDHISDSNINNDNGKGNVVTDDNTIDLNKLITEVLDTIPNKTVRQKFIYILECEHNRVYIDWSHLGFIDLEMTCHEMGGNEFTRLHKIIRIIGVIRLDDMWYDRAERITLDYIDKYKIDNNIKHPIGTMSSPCP